MSIPYLSALARRNRTAVLASSIWAGKAVVRGEPVADAGGHVALAGQEREPRPQVLLVPHPPAAAVEADDARERPLAFGRPGEVELELAVADLGVDDVEFEPGFDWATGGDGAGEQTSDCIETRKQSD